MRCIEGGQDISLEIECDPRLQRRDWAAEHVGQAVMLLVVLIALTGLLGGGGPLSHTRLTAANGAMQVDYDRLLRQQTDSEITWTLRASQGPARLGLSQDFLNRLSARETVPAPAAIRGSGDQAVLVFDLPEGRPLLVSMGVQAKRVGVLHSPVTLNGQPVGDLRIWVLP
ncbi:MAG: hypothetical protein ACM3VW_03925 [Bacteroidota bacterium]